MGLEQRSHMLGVMLGKIPLVVAWRRRWSGEDKTWRVCSFIHGLSEYLSSVLYHFAGEPDRLGPALKQLIVEWRS